MEQTLDEAAEFKECFKCKFKGVTPSVNCPNCGRKLYGPKQIRRRGIVQVISGGFLVVFMGAIAILVGLMLTDSMKNPDSAKKIHDEAGTLLVIYAIFGLVIIFGLHGLIMGVWQIATGRRNTVLIWIMWVLLFGLLFVAGAFMGMNKFA
jgi:succinate dehydrogenase/fumarate reductase cytochrome b subunit